MAYSGATPPSPQAAAVMIGIAIVAGAVAALWRRNELYLAFQWIIRYPQHGVVYGLLQIVIPAALAAGGIAMILWPIVGW